MLRFEWSAFVTPAVTARLATEAGVTEAVVSDLTPVLVQILDRVGGLPFVEVEPPIDERTAWGLTLLSEAVAHTLADAGAVHERSGYVTTEAGGEPYARRVTALPLVNVNSADVDELAVLPGLSPGLLGEVIAERRRGGRFADVVTFERRVDGIGPVRAAAIASALTFDNPHASRRPILDARADLGTNLRTLMGLQPDTDRTDAFRRAVDMIATACATSPHPASSRFVRRLPAQIEPLTGYDATWVGELWSDAYWKALPGILGGATSSIEVCMFHIAAPGTEHPTHALLEGLVQAHQRGVTVRVLVDSDEKTDPYRSTVINARARRLLQDAGIACRFDSTYRLLHSKYLILDAGLSLVGSHNWSAGSYFDFDDLTLAIASPAFAAELRARFETLWASAH